MNILLISAHADDIELGCGGSVVKLLENGERIFWAVFTVTYNEHIPEECLKVMRVLDLKETDGFHAYASGEHQEIVGNSPPSDA